MLEANGTKSKVKDESTKRKSGLAGLFRFASGIDLLLSGIGLFFAIITGAGLPTLALVFGQMTNTFIQQATQGLANLNDNNNVTNKSSENDIITEEFGNFTTDFLRSETAWSTVTDSSQIYLTANLTLSSTEATWMTDPLTGEEFLSYMTQFSLYYVYIGIAVLVAAFFQTLCWEVTCERQVYRLRQEFFRQVLRQDIGWFDEHQTGNLTTKLSDDIERIREGIGSKFSLVTQYVATFVSGLVVGLIANWKLTLVILALSPILAGMSGFMARIVSSSAAREQLKYGIAGGIAEEVISCIRTVAAFGGQKQEIKRYEAALEDGRQIAMRKYYILSVGLGVVFFTTYGSYGLAFWYGAELIGEGEFSPGSVFTVFFSVMAGAFSLGNALPFINAVSTAIGSASTIFDIIDRVPNIDPYSKEGAVPKEVKGHLKFKNVTFAYPSRPEIEVLQNFSINIEPGKTVALVGSSGAGKSTVIGLLLRFYDPLKGQVLLDDRNIQELNLSWLRRQIGVVSQEPVLFGTSIYENIRYGREDVSFAEVVEACKMANAHDFIVQLPESYNTLVGDRGAQMSGGQKQRIAIARALVRNPKILLLDEATSALDANSEGIVQEALDKAMKGRTTIIVAHRLSTVKNADVIYALKDGEVVEYGTHGGLMDKHNLYYNLVMAQTTDEQETEDTSDGNLGYETEDSIIRQSSRRISRKSHQSSRASSVQDLVIEQLKRDLEEVRPDDVSTWRVVKLNSPEWLILIFGMIGCAMNGCVMPIYAFYYGEMFATFTLTGEELKKAAVFWALMFLVLAVVSALSMIIQTVFMCTAAEKMVMRLRMNGYVNILRQAVGWFDFETNSAGRLTTRLARDAPLVKGAAGLRAGIVISSLVTLVAALAIAFIYGWKLALLLLVAVPIIAGASYQQMMILRRNQRRDAELMDEAGRISSDSIQNVRTVQALGKEQLFFKIYMENLLAPHAEAVKQAYIYAVVFAFSQAVIFLMYAAAFRFGAYLIEIGDMTSTDVYRVFFALAFCAASVGQSSAYMQDYSKAKMAAALMFQLIDVKSDIDAYSSGGVKPNVRGKVTFKDIHFRYPTRADVLVLKGLSFTVEPGHTLALVGASGCGKSTIVSLIERFYDPLKGQILVDDFDIRTMNLSHLRSQIGLVTQEPVLFDSTIKENIMYGTSKDIPFDKVINATRAANIHDFITNLPQGYDTMVGERGAQLSGGQKQRIAIARALIRNPKILLLDEATSALDTESEKVVQEALDRAREGRTCIIIAHRLSTVQNADSIAVIHKGQIVEQGTHEELKSKKGRYYELIKRQRIQH